jgi:hypothetical protein
MVEAIGTRFYLVLVLVTWGWDLKFPIRWGWTEGFIWRVAKPVIGWEMQLLFCRCPVAWDVVGFILGWQLCRLSKVIFDLIKVRFAVGRD